MIRRFGGLVLPILALVSCHNPRVADQSPSSPRQEATHPLLVSPAVSSSATAIATAAPVPRVPPAKRLRSFPIYKVNVRSDGSSPREYYDQVWGGMLSGDGRWAVFTAPCNGLLDSPCPDQETNETRRCTWLEYTPRGEQIMLPMCRWQDVYLRDLRKGKTVRLSQLRNGSLANGDSSLPVISHDGSVVAFETNATNLVRKTATIVLSFPERQVFEVAARSLRGVPIATYPSTKDFVLSADGKRFAFASDASDLVSDDKNGEEDVFVHDLEQHWTRRVSVSSEGAEGSLDSCSPSLSGNGRFVAFETRATNLIPSDPNGITQDILVHDLETGKTWQASVGMVGDPAQSLSSAPTLSADGEWVAFESAGGNLEGLAGLYNVYVHGNVSGVTERISTGWDGSVPDGRSNRPSLSADGRYVAFESDATNLVPWDTNGVSDVFVTDRKRKRTIRISQELSSTETRTGGDHCSMSADGRYVMFRSGSRNLLEPGDARPPLPDNNMAFFVADLEHTWDDENEPSKPDAK
jgi:Tol biopolymer transport system component